MENNLKAKQINTVLTVWRTMPERDKIANNFASAAMDYLSGYEVMYVIENCPLCIHKNWNTYWSHYTCDPKEAKEIHDRNTKDRVFSRIRIVQISESSLVHGDIVGSNEHLLNA